ncbi:lipase [Enterovibrio sp. ZSDZ35]|uniref:Lipase n=1 Tax=Enterovibrio qingdaonensis TaxID=2899818 RepID=A0ABT5QGY5_9GAMM|nr:lipase [Enterovibrio sp. ZSDZ35]MDD1780236.1 lipase [Enterovibrio sp. ZSDZ35]
MKRLKRYQYERYAILCRDAYPKAFDHLQYGFSPNGRKDITNRWGQTIIRVLWREDGDVVVVFKGSQSVWDWLLNLVFVPSRVDAPQDVGHVHWGFHFLLRQRSRVKRRFLHQDFVKLSTSQQAELEQSVQGGDFQGYTVMESIESTVLPLLKQGKRLSLTGHSSGGSMAIIAAEILEQKYPNAVKRVVTFGQPATGYWNFKRLYRLQNKTYRICCDVDIVTFLPGIPLLFWHVGDLLWLHNDRIYRNMPSFVRIIRVLTSWLIRPIAYHFMDKYIRRKDYFDKH